MADHRSYGKTDCPTPDCGKTIAVVLGDVAWEYLCPKCGKAFRFEIKPDEDDLGE